MSSQFICLPLLGSMQVFCSMFVYVWGTINKWSGKNVDLRGAYWSWKKQQEIKKKIKKEI